MVKVLCSIRGIESPAPATHCEILAQLSIESNQRGGQIGGVSVRHFIDPWLPALQFVSLCDSEKDKFQWRNNELEAQRRFWQMEGMNSPKAKW